MNAFLSLNFTFRIWFIIFLEVLLVSKRWILYVWKLTGNHLLKALWVILYLRLYQKRLSICWYLWMNIFSIKILLNCFYFGLDVPQVQSTLHITITALLLRWSNLKSINSIQSFLNLLLQFLGLLSPTSWISIRAIIT